MRSKIFATVVLAIGSIVAIGNSPALAIGATTDPATGVTEAGAVLSGTVTHATGSYITAIAIAPTPSFAQSVYSYSGVCDPAMQVQLRRGQVFDVLGGSGTAHVSEDMRFWNASCAMSPLTTYYYLIGIQDPIDNACVYSMSCYTWGSTESFTTRAALLPTVGVATSAEVGPDSALLGQQLRRLTDSQMYRLSTQLQLHWRHPRRSASDVSTLQASTGGSERRSPTRVRRD